MASFSSPPPPQYRVTLFYGPEPVASRPSRVACVFNVKKRSWKGGVQVAVELDETQVERAREAAGLALWLETVLAGVPAEEREDYAGRAQDLFVQGLCATKLELALGGLQQENSSLGADMLARELERAVPRQSDRIKAQILAELDLPAASAE